MKLAKNLRIINWHYISDETVDFKMVNFITGKSGTGKSTMLDALQLLFQGDTNGNYFNKAANENGKRSLMSYVKGKAGDDENDLETYIRQGDFTTHIALEIYDDKKDESFIIGFVMDVYSNDNHEKNFYIVDGGIECLEFIIDEYPINISLLEEQFRKQKRSFKFFKKQSEYRYHLRAKLGNLNEKFFAVMKKATAFSPIDNIKSFITDYICDSENHVDITDLQENIRQYERLKYESEVVERMINSLRGIQSKYEEYESCLELVDLYDYLIIKGEIESLNDEINENKMTQKRNLIFLENSVEATDILVNCIQKFEIEYERIITELANYESERIKAKAIEKISELSDRNDTIKNDVDKFVTRLNKVVIPWKSAIVRYNDKPNREIGYIDLDFETMINSLKNNDFSFDLEILRDKIYHLKNNVKGEHLIKKKELDEVNVNLEKSEQIYNNLLKGRRNYDKSLLRIKDAVQGGLRKSLQNDCIDVSILCEMIDLKDDKWREAIEGYLGCKRFDLIVEPKYFETAYKLYKKFTTENNLHSFGLVDLRGVADKKVKSKVNSLAEEIITDNSMIKHYTSFLLGNVMKCEKDEEIRDYSISITPDCYLYKGFVVKKMNPSVYMRPYIGKSSVEKQLIDYKIRISQLTESKMKLTNELSQLDLINSRYEISDDHIQDYDFSKIKQDRIIENIEEIRKQNDLIDSLDLTVSLKLQNRLDEVKVELENKRKEKNELDRKVKLRINQNEEIILEIIPKLTIILAEKKNEVVLNYDENFIINKGNPKYIKENINKSSKEISLNYNTSKKRAENQSKKVFEELMNLRINFEKEENRSLGVTSKQNNKYVELLEMLEKTSLPEYRQKIESALGKAQMEFRDDFIAKLKSNIENAKRQIDELNYALKHSRFGRDKYRFTYRPNENYREFYDMIMEPLLMNGFSITSSAFQERHNDTLEKLFRVIINTGEGSLSIDEKEELERNIAIYTDYRTYLDFDMLSESNEGLKNKLSKSIGSNSGGEGQTPFYIAILASLSRIYGMNDKRKQDGFRLIMLDEAFGKMDDERTREYMEILKEFNFQALICAPPSQIGGILPHSDKTMCAIRKGGNSVLIPWERVNNSMYEEAYSEEGIA